MNVSIETGSNYSVVHFQNFAIWTSYSTVIGFFTRKTGFVARQNDWGPTTGKHLNAVEPDKKKRVPGAEFETRLAEVLKAFGLTD